MLEELFIKSREFVALNNQSYKGSPEKTEYIVR